MDSSYVVINAKIQFESVPSSLLLVYELESHTVAEAFSL